MRVYATNYHFLPLMSWVNNWELEDGVPEGIPGTMPCESTVYWGACCFCAAGLAKSPGGGGAAIPLRSADRGIEFCGYV